jgi:hypothetical protein
MRTSGDWLPKALAFSEALERETKSVRRAVKILARLEASKSLSEKAHGKAWDEAVNVLKRHGLSTPDSGMLSWR